MISGNFSSVDGTIRNRVARLNADGTLDAAFNPNVNSFTEELILQPDGKIVIGGSFTTVGGVARNGVARLNADGTLDTTFNVGSGVQLNNGPGSVYAMERQPDGKILIGGDFDFYNGNFRNNLARINADGSFDASFNPSVGGFGAEYFIVQPDGKILAAGSFSFGSIRYGLLRFNADGTNDNSFALTPVDDLGYVLALQTDGKIVLGGFFTDGVKRFNSNGSLDSGFNASVKIGATIRTIKVQTDGKILIGGDFRFVNGTARRNIARLNADGTLDTSFNPGSGADSQVYSIGVQPDGKVLIGGLFTSVNGTPRNLVARLNADGSLDANFEFPFALSAVYDIEVQTDGKIILGGFFIIDGFQTFGGIVRLLDNGSFDTSIPFFQGTNGFVLDVEILPDNKYLIAGSFSTYTNISRNRIARLNSDLSLDTSFNPGTGASSSVWDVAPLADGKMYLAGTFVSFNGSMNYRNVVRLNANGSVDAAFASGSGFNGGLAYSIVPQTDGKVLVGGAFFNYQTIPANHLAQLNADGSLDTSFVSGIPADGFVFKLAKQTEDKILVGGRFDSYGGQPRNSLVRLSSAAPRRAPFDFDGDGKTDLSIFRPSAGEWWINRSSTNSVFAAQFGSSSDKIVPADYTGDGKTDFAFWQPSTGQWFILRSEDLSFYAFPFGASGDTPVPADYDGDGKADAAVFRESSLTWYIQKSMGGTDIVQFGASGDKPVIGDYDGDGRADIAIFRPTGANGAEWWIRRSSTGGVFAAQFGAATDKPVPADYTGDGKTDIAFWQPPNGTWFILRSEDFSYYAFGFGISTDIPVAGDYDGDGRADAGVFRPADANWYAQRSTAGTLIQQFGIAGDLPVPSAYVP